MWNDLDVIGWDAITALQYLGPPRCHHDHIFGPCQQAPQHHLLLLGRIFEDSVQRDDQWDMQRADELQHMRSGRASENPILVL